MKALTICQPYAHLIMTGEKLVENRTWYTNYRGPLLIHAGKSRAWLGPDDEEKWPLVFGAILGHAHLDDCGGKNELLERHPKLRGHSHVHGPYCWKIVRPVWYVKKIPYRGQQGLFEIPDSVITHDQ